MGDFEPNKPKINLWNFIEKPKWDSNEYFRQRFHTKPEYRAWLNEWKRNYRATPEYKQKEKQRRQSIRLEAIILFENPPKCQCPHCDETDIKFLTFHHIYGEGRKQRKEVGHGTQTQFYRWIINNIDDAKKILQVLCFNCNMAKKFFGECHSEVKT
jgi:hypothetical protein